MAASIVAIIEEHLKIWNSPISDERTDAVARTYSSDVLVAEPDAAYRGWAGVEQAIDGLHGVLPGMRLTLTGPIQTARELSTYPWALAPEGGAVMVTGRDVLAIEDGAITALYIFIDVREELAQS